MLHLNPSICVASRAIERSIAMADAIEDMHSEVV